MSAKQSPEPPLSLIGMSHAEMVDLCLRAGVKAVHADHLRAAIYRHGITDIDRIGDIPQRLKTYIRSHADMTLPACSASQGSRDGTRKLLLAMSDGKEVETVLIPGKGRITQCISTQVGCAVGCTFCLTATAGLTRNLTASEMLAEVMAGRQQTDGQLRNLVLMGMGEPLHNYEQVARFVRIVTDPRGMAFSPRRVTLSTSGMIPGIRRMTEENLPCNLALSLNATTDEVRSKIIPLNRKYPIGELMQCIRDYIGRRGDKRVLIEYVMLAGVNDSIADARRLVTLLDGLKCTVNLLPFNPYPGSAFRRPDDATVEQFRDILIRASLVAVIRQSRGRDISAACGQLKTDVRQKRAASL